MEPCGRGQAKSCRRGVRGIGACLASSWRIHPTRSGRQLPAPDMEEPSNHHARWIRSRKSASPQRSRESESKHHCSSRHVNHGERGQELPDPRSRDLVCYQGRAGSSHVSSLSVPSFSC